MLAAVGKQTELGERREHLRPVVAVLTDDVSTTDADAAQTRYLLSLLQHHHADCCTVTESMQELKQGQVSSPFHTGKFSSKATFESVKSRDCTLRLCMAPYH